MSDDVKHADIEAAVKAIEMVVKAPDGVGVLVCPKCGGEMRYVSRKRPGIRKNTYAAQCATKDCISFSGH